MLARGFHHTKKRGECDEAGGATLALRTDGGRQFRQSRLLPNRQRSAIRQRLFFRLGVILREAATEALLFGEMVGIVQGRQVRNPFFSRFATI